MSSIKDLKRMCNKYDSCDGCPLSEIRLCTTANFPDNIEELVDKWVKEHPVKTYAQDFFEKFPNASRDIDGTPKTCWGHVYGNEKYCSSDDCTECWNREVKENG